MLIALRSIWIAAKPKLARECLERTRIAGMISWNIMSWTVQDGRHHHITSRAGPLSVAPPSGCNLICKDPPLPGQYNNQSQGEFLRSVNHSPAYAAGSPPPSCSAYWAVPLSRTDAVSVQICSSSNCKQWWRTDNNNRAENAPTLPTSKRKNKTNVEKQCKKKELDQAREKTWINIGASFQSRSGGICKDSRATQSWLLFCWTSKDTYLICFILCFNHKAMVVAVTVILAIAHIILRYCSPAM